MRFRLRIRNSLHEQSVLHVICCGVAGIWLIVSFFHDFPQSIFSALLREIGVGILVVSVPINFVGSVLPLAAVLWLYPQVSEHRKDVENRWPSVVVVGTQLLGYVGIFLVVGVLITFWIVADLYFSISVVPLSTTLCGVIWICVGSRLLRKTKLNRGYGLTVLSICLCIILSVKFIDWNKRKSFIRDLYQIRAGSTVTQVDEIMAGYIKGTGLRDPVYSDQEFTVRDSIVYRHSTGASYGSDWGTVEFRDGKVVKVDFSPD